MKKIKYILFGIMTMLISMPTVFAEDYTNYIACGDSAIPAPIPAITRVIILILQILIPIIIIIMGSLDLMKSIAADPDKIKNGQKQFIKRLTAAGIFFLVITITKFVVSIAADSSESSIADCVDCMISDAEKCGEITTDGPFDVAKKK